MKRLVRGTMTTTTKKKMVMMVMKCDCRAYSSESLKVFPGRMLATKSLKVMITITTSTLTTIDKSKGMHANMATTPKITIVIVQPSKTLKHDTTKLQTAR